VTSNQLKPLLKGSGLTLNISWFFEMSTGFFSKAAIAVREAAATAVIVKTSR
jgi:hypothetical protein